MQAPPHLLHKAEAPFVLAVPHGMPRAGHSHAGRALWAMVDECCLLLKHNLLLKDRVGFKLNNLFKKQVVCGAFKKPVCG